MLIIIASTATMNTISIIISITSNTTSVTVNNTASIVFNVSNVSNESHLLLVDRADWIHEVMN